MVGGHKPHGYWDRGRLPPSFALVCLVVGSLTLITVLFNGWGPESVMI